MLTQHGIHVFADDHAGGFFIRELFVECEAQLAKEFNRAHKVGDWHVDKDSVDHETLLMRISR